MEQCKNLHYIVKELIKNLKQYVCAPDGRDETEATEWALSFPATPRAIINYIDGGLVDDKHHSKR